jgi:hypothetical protein
MVSVIHTEEATAILGHSILLEPQDLSGELPPGLKVTHLDADVTES